MEKQISEIYIKGMFLVSVKRMLFTSLLLLSKDSAGFIVLNLLMGIEGNLIIIYPFKETVLL